MPCSLTESRRVPSEDDIVALCGRPAWELSVSRSGRQGAVVTGWTDSRHSEYSHDIMQRVLWALEIGSEAQILICDRDAHAPAWSNSGQTLAYLSRASGTTEVWRSSQDGHDRQQLTTAGAAGDNPFPHAQLIWTPDDDRLVLAVNSPTAALAVSQLRTISSAGGDLRLIANLDISIGRLLGWRCRDHELLLSSGSVIAAVRIPSGATRVLTPQAHCLAALDESGGIWLVSQDCETLRVFRLEVGGDRPVCECRFDPATDVPIALLADAEKLYVLRHHATSRILVEYDLRTGLHHDVTGLDQVAAPRGSRCEIPSLPSRGPLWLPVSTVSQPAEIFVCAPGSGLRKTSQLNPLADHVALPEVRRVKWESDGWQVEGLLLQPSGAQTNPACPTLVYLHGGPEQSVENAFETLASPRGESAAYYLSSHEFAVLLVNFRGSVGYGRDFMAQLGDYHLFDRPFADVMTAVDALVAQGLADPQAVGVYGHSYGAELAVWALGHTDRFRGAMAVAGRYDQESLARYSGTPFHTLTETRRGSASPDEVWQRPELWQHLCPMRHAHKIRTPLLLIETSAERRPGQEARPLFNTLQAQGVETCLVYYPAAFHTGGWHAHYQSDYMRRTLAWFRHALLGAKLPAWFWESRQPLDEGQITV